MIKPEDNGGTNAAETLSSRPNQTLVSTQTVTHEYLTLSGKVVRETVRKNGSVTDVMDFVYDESGRPFALIHQTDGVGITLCTYYYVLNLQGDVVKLVTASGDVVANYEYDAWGNILSQSGEMASINPLRYRGYYYDTETGFYYLQSRYYDPVNRRFINADSYASTGQGFIGCNMFAYCRNSPSSRVDQTGDYDRDAAVEYADDWNEEPNEGEYEYFGGRGGDCANFVSQCLQAGGVELTDDWYYKRHAAWSLSMLVYNLIMSGTIYSWNYSDSWRFADDHYSYFSNPDNKYINGEPITITEKSDLRSEIKKYNIQKGDLLYFQSSNRVYHATIISSVDSDMIYYSAHSKSCFDKPLSENFSYTVFVVRIRDDA